MDVIWRKENGLAELGDIVLFAMASMIPVLRARISPQAYRVQRGMVVEQPVVRSEAGDWKAWLKDAMPVLLPVRTGQHLTIASYSSSASRVRLRLMHHDECDAAGFAGALEWEDGSVTANPLLMRILARRVLLAVVTLATLSIGASAWMASQGGHARTALRDQLQQERGLVAEAIEAKARNQQSSVFAAANAMGLPYLQSREIVTMLAELSAATPEGHYWTALTLDGHLGEIAMARRDAVTATSLPPLGQNYLWASESEHEGLSGNGFLVRYEVIAP
jgi:hypothetical protein